MSIAIVNGGSVAYNEPSRSSSLLPGHIRENGEARIVEMIRDYYKYLNSENGPSHELQNLIKNHDIDAMSDKYLTAIQLQIARSVPNSKTLDKRRLFKTIAQYYKTRGSEESIHIFFRIFFNEFISIFYPSSEIFHSSNEKSKSSDRFKIQDGERWQKYSYEIRTLNNPAEWKNAFLKFVHPAGLKLLIAVLVFSFADNTWEGEINQYIENANQLQPDQYWEYVKSDLIKNKNSPKWQPNTRYDVDYLFKVIIETYTGHRTQTYPIDTIDSSHLYASILEVLLDLNIFSYGSSEIFRTQYQSWLKFKDTVRINEGYSDKTVKEASAKYKPINECRFEVLKSNISISDDYNSSAVNTADQQPTQSDWSQSTLSTDDQSYNTILRTHSLAYIPEADEIIFA